MTDQADALGLAGTREQITRHHRPDDTAAGALSTEGLLGLFSSGSGFAPQQTAKQQHGHSRLLKMLLHSMGKVKPFFLKFPGRDWRHPKFGP